MPRSPDSPRPEPISARTRHEHGGESLGEGLSNHLKARAELLGIEAREVGAFAGKKAALAVAIALLLFFTYALVVAAAVGFLERGLAALWPASAVQLRWPIACMVVALLHIGVAFILFKMLKSKPDHGFFAFTRAEFEKDREWLNRPKKPGNANERSR